MKKYIILGLLLITLISALSGQSKRNNKTNYKIERKHKVIVNNENCEVSFYYPEIISSDTNLTKLNELLYKTPDYGYYTQHCDDTVKYSKKKVIIGEYNVLLKNDTLLSIEYLMYSPSLEKKSSGWPDTIYHALVINTKKINDKDKLDNLSYPSLPDFVKGKLYPYVEKFDKERNANINLLCYQDEQHATLIWGITKDKFIIYAGGEGENYGFYKIVIPLKELKRKDKNKFK